MGCDAVEKEEGLRGRRPTCGKGEYGYRPSRGGVNVSHLQNGTAGR